MRQIFIFVTLIILQACQTLVEDVDLEPVDPKLVVTGYVCPQMDSTVIQINFSYPKKGPLPDFNLLQTAKVEIKQDTAILLLQKSQEYTYYNTVTYYISNILFPIEEGKEYNLMVSLTNGDTVRAKCMVPVKPAANFEFADVKHVSGSLNDSPYTSFRLKFLDAPNQENFYLLSGETYDYYYYLEDTVILINKYYFDIPSQMFTDHTGGYDFDGKTMYSNLIKKDDTPEDSKNYILFCSIDENYYRYHSTFNNSESGVFIEPSLVYTNIENGLGYFGAVSYRSREIRF